jgi:S-adenosylmethionine hydrolase
MPKSLIAFLTDFGTRDHYAGVMKGVIHSINPDATIVDISHDVPPHDIAFGAMELSATYKYFPAGTIFVVVVDPGVGSSRRGLAVEAGEWRFVGPDNGVLTSVLEEQPAKKVVELTERRYARPTVSRTFEGRDRFAPAAAWLSRGVHLSAFGRPLSDYCLIDLPKPSLDNGTIHGVVVRIDRFGNVVTNLDRRSCEKLTESTSAGVLHLTVGDRSIARIVSTYADIAPGEIAALFGSTDHLECAAHKASAADALGVSVGDRVELRRT